MMIIEKMLQVPIYVYRPMSEADPRCVSYFCC